MRTQSADTAPEIERRQILRVRELPVARKFASIRSTAMMLVTANIAAAHPEQIPERTDSDAHDAAKFVARQFGLSVSPELATAIDQRCGRTDGQFDILAALLDVTGALHDLRIRYALAGQLVCALYGFPRPVFTIEMLTDSSVAQLAAQATIAGSELVLCEPIDLTDPVNAAYSNAEFAQMDFLHLPTLVKIIIQQSRTGDFTRSVVRHSEAFHLVDGMAPISMATPEHTVLLAITAFQRHGDDDRWNDILGVLKVQTPTLNLITLSRMGERLGISLLLQQALQEAGIVA